MVWRADTLTNGGPSGGRAHRLWVPETPLTSCGLLIFMEEAAEPVVAADAGEVGLAVFRERT
jgi:hypothetical protein